MVVVVALEIRGGGMLLRCSGVPFSISQLVISRVAVINERYSFRPDQLVHDLYRDDFFLEVFCNEVSNVSPLGVVPGFEYRLPSVDFLKHFLEVGS